MHAVVARSTFPSQNVKNTTCSGHFEKLKCRQNARVAGARDCAPCKGFVAISPKTISTPLQLQPPHHTTLHSTTHHYTTLHYTTLRYATLHCTTLRYTTLHYTTLHYTTQQPQLQVRLQQQLHQLQLQLQLRYITLQYTKLHELHYTTLRYTTLHYTTLHYIPLHSTTLITPHHNIPQLQLQPHLQLHYTKLPFHYTTTTTTPRYTSHYATSSSCAR